MNQFQNSNAGYTVLHKCYLKIAACIDPLPSVQLLELKGEKGHYKGNFLL